MELSLLGSGRLEPLARFADGPASPTTRPARGPKVPECHVPARKSRLAETHAPSVTLPLRFIVTGLLSLFVGVGMIVARPEVLATYHYNQYVIAITHLFVLGFISTIVMGAMYQLVPVALETRLHSERLARWQYFAHLIGFAGMVWMFWKWDMKQVGHFGSVLALGVGWFVYNLWRTLRTIPRWNVVAAGIAASLAWLSLTVLAGLYLASSKCWNFSPFDPIAAMHAHAHLGVMGVFVVLIMAVSFKLVPMFTLSEVRSVRRAGWSLALVNLGLAGTVAGILLQRSWKLAFALTMVAGLVLYGLELAAILRARKRRVLDWGMWSFLAALVLLLVLSPVGLMLGWPGLPATLFTTQLETAYGFVAIVGVVGLAILGMLCKIVPFLVWYHSYSRHVGKAKVPSLADMSVPFCQAAGSLVFLGALAVVTAGALTGSEAGVRAGSLLLAAALALFGVNFAVVISHWIRPRLSPLMPPGPISVRQPALS